MTIDLKLVREWVQEAKQGCESLGYEEGTQAYKDHIRRSVYTRRHNYLLREQVKEEFEDYEKRVVDGARRIH